MPEPPARGDAAAVPPAPPAPAAPRTPARERALRTALAVALVAVVAAIYAPVRHHEFVDLDDWAGILYNPDVRASSLGAVLHGAFNRPQVAMWAPLSTLSLQLDWRLHGPAPAGYLLTNVALHALASVLLLAVLVAMTGATGASAFVAATFAVHPLHVESVAWASERKDVLSGVFWMLTLLAYVRYARRPAARGRYALVMLCFGLGLLAKPMLVTLPLALLLLDYWPLRRLDADAVREKGPMLALGALDVLMTLRAQSLGGALSYGTSVPLWARAANAVDAYVAYLAQAFWPSGLAAYYPHPGTSIPPARVAVEALGLLALSAGAFALRRRRPYALVGWLWYLGTLVPVIGLVQVGSQARADRYTYIPLIGIALVVAFGARDLLAGRRALGRALSAGAAAAVAGLAVVAHAQVDTWRDSFTLFEHALDVSPDAAFPHVRLGMLYAMQGRVDRAEQHFEQALALDPGQGRTIVDQLASLAAAHAHMGRLHQASDTAELAVAMARRTGQSEREPELRARIADYRAGRAGPVPAPPEP